MRRGHEIGARPNSNRKKYDADDGAKTKGQPKSACQTQRARGTASTTRLSIKSEVFIAARAFLTRLALLIHSRRDMLGSMPMHCINDPSARYGSTLGSGRGASC